MVILCDESERTTESVEGIFKFGHDRASSDVVGSSKRSLQRRPDSQRKVKFDDNEQIICYVSEPLDNEIKERWWRSRDIKCFALNAKVNAQESRLGKRSIDQGYNGARYTALTVEEEQLHDVLSNIEMQLTPELMEWSERPDTCRGLEHWCSRQHWEARRETLRDLNDLRDELTKSRLRGTHIDDWAVQFQEYSRPSRILARMLGHADEVAALALQDQDKPDQVHRL